MELLIIVLATVLFGLQHSGLSALRIKTYILDHWGSVGYSRLFTATSVLTFLIAFLSMNYWDWLYFLNTPDVMLELPFLAGGLLLTVGAFIAYNASKVISVSSVADMRSDRTPDLVTTGIYSRVRHPLYLAAILFFFALPLFYTNIRVLFFSLSMICYTVVGAYLEERKLVLKYGAAYLKYKKQVGFLLPKLRSK